MLSLKKGVDDSMPKIRNHVCLTADERNTLLSLVSKGSAPVKMIMHANILLAADENGIQGRASEVEIAECFHVSKQTVHNVRQRYSEKGLDAAIGRKKRDTPPVPAKITGDVEARIIAMSCSANHRRDAAGGHCAFWPAKRLSWRSSTAFPTWQLARS